MPYVYGEPVTRALIEELQYAEDVRGLGDAATELLKIVGEAYRFLKDAGHHASGCGLMADTCELEEMLAHLDANRWKP